MSRYETILILSKCITVDGIPQNMIGPFSSDYAAELWFCDHADWLDTYKVENVTLAHIHMPSWTLRP